MDNQTRKLNAFCKFTVLIKSLSGRDKVNKTIQYSSKTLWYAFNQSNIYPNIVTKLKKLDSGISTARKVDRLLWSFIDIQEIIETLRDEKSDFIKILTVISALCSSYYWYCDNKAFLYRIGVLKDIDINVLNLHMAKFDVVGTGIALFLLFIKYKQYNTDQDEDDKRQKLQLHKAKLLGTFCDFMHALDDCGIIEKIFNSPLNDGQYGIIGLISALTVLYRCWIKIA